MSKDYDPHDVPPEHIKHACVDARCITGETPDEAKHRILEDLWYVKDALFIGTGHIRQPTDWYDKQMEKEKLAIHPIDINKPESECEK